MPLVNPADRDNGPAVGFYRRFVGWACVFVICLTLYALTAARSIQWQDYGHFVLRIIEGELSNELGLALAHPLHFWLGQFFVAVFPFSPAHAVALVSAFAGALTIANVFGCCWSLTRRWDAALIAALGLAMANTFWRMSAMPECYTVTTALLSAELWCLALYCRGVRAGRVSPCWLITAALFNGLGLANHNLALLTIPILCAVTLHGLVGKKLRLTHTLLAGAVWMVGALPYLVLVVSEAFAMGDAIAAVRSALFGNHFADDVMNASPSIKLLGISIAFTVLSFFNLTLPLAAVGIWSLLRDQSRRLLGLAWGAGLLIHLLFVLRYNVIDQHTFLLPAYTFFALFAGVGFAGLTERFSPTGARRLLVAAIILSLAAPGVYLAAATAARSQEVLGDYARNKPYRDDYRYLFVPWGAGETSANRMADHALRLAGDRGIVVVSDSMASFAVKYLAHQRQLMEVDIYVLPTNADIPWDEWSGRRVAWVPANTEAHEMPALPKGYLQTHDPPLYVLIPEGESRAPQPAPE